MDSVEVSEAFDYIVSSLEINALNVKKSNLVNRTKKSESPQNMEKPWLSDARKNFEILENGVHKVYV
ncbi:15781_t:CDS:2 [Entrophospora sp. SA101]|nr:15781_t:CDS:2 [Entrophospora sp. SA101]